VAASGECHLHDEGLFESEALPPAHPVGLSLRAVHALEGLQQAGKVAFVDDLGGQRVGQGGGAVRPPTSRSSLPR
jgi:hypothetical protein